MTPIDVLLNNLDWREVPASKLAEDSDLPWVTHEGVLEVSEIRLRCYQLSDGTRVINGDDMAAMFGEWILGGENG